MAGIKIHQYPLERTSIGDEDYYDIDYYTGSGYQTAKIKGSTLKNVLGANYIDIQDFSSGYTLKPTDAGKLITNAGSPFRDLIVDTTLQAPGHGFTVKGRVEIKPAVGVNIDLPDGTTITNPSSFICGSESFYVLQRKGFTGTNWMLVEVKKSENLATNDLTQEDFTRNYNFPNGNYSLRFIQGAFAHMVLDTVGGSPTLLVGKNSNGTALHVNKVSGSGDALLVQGGNSNFSNNKLINVADPTNPQDAVTLAYFNANMYGGKRYTLIKPNGTKEFYDTLTQVRSNWADGDVLHQFADEQITYASSSTVDGRNCMFSLPEIKWSGNGFTLDLIGTVPNSHDFFTAFNKNVTFFKLKLIFNGTAGVNRNILRASGTSVINGCYNTDISASSEIDRILVNTNAEAYNFTSLINGFTGSIVNGSGKAYNCTSKNGLYSTNGSVSVFNFTFLNYGNIWGTSKIYNSFFYYANYRVTQNQSVEFYNCYFEITGTPASSSPIFQYTESGAVKAKFFDCEIKTTSINDVFQCNSTGAGSHEIKNVKIYAPSGRIGTFNSASVVIEGCHFEALGGNAISSSDTGTTKFIRKSYIKSSANVINTGVWDISDTTLETTNSASYCLSNQAHKLSGLTFIGSNAPVNSNVFATSPSRLSQCMDYLGNIGHGLRSKYPKMTTEERDALTGVEKGYAIENTTTNFLQVYNGSTWKDLLDLT